MGWISPFNGPDWICNLLRWRSNYVARCKLEASKLPGSKFDLIPAKRPQLVPSVVHASWPIVGRPVGGTRPSHGIVRLTGPELADQQRLRHSRGELTPFSERGSAVLLEDIAAVEVAVLVEMVVDRGVNGGKLLQGL